MATGFGNQKYYLINLLTFFLLEGIPLKAVELTEHILQSFEIEVSLKDIFIYPTIAELATLIKESKAKSYVTLKVVPQQAYLRLGTGSKRFVVVVTKRRYF